MDGRSCNAKSNGTGGVKGTQGISDSIVNAVAGMAAKSAAGFVLNKVGLGALIDGSQANFNSVTNRLQAISDQLTALHNALQTIDGELRQINLNQFTIPLEQKVDAIKNLYDNKFSAAVDAAVYYAEQDRIAKAAGQPCDPNSDPKTVCGQALSNFEKYRDAFYAEEDKTDNQVLNTDIHAFLMPTFGDSAIIAFGKVLMGGETSTGFLTAADSAKLFAFYDYFSEYEALAVLMKAEYLAIFDSGLPNPEAKFHAFLDKEVSGPCAAPNQAQQCGYFDLEQRELPARIPEGAVISLPPDTTKRTTTLNQPMWLWDSKLQPSNRPAANLQWDPNAALGTPGSVPWALDALNTNAVDGFSDWQVPSKKAWDSLFVGRATAPFVTASGTPYSGVRFLATILPNTSISFIPILETALTSTGRGYVWTSEAPATVQCLQTIPGTPPTDHLAGQLTAYAHAALPVSASIGNYPGQFPVTTVPNINAKQYAPTNLTNAQALQYCRDNVAAAVTKSFTTGAAAAQLIATRSTTVNYMPVAVPVP